MSQLPHRFLKVKLLFANRLLKVKLLFAGLAVVFVLKDETAIVAIPTKAVTKIPKLLLKKPNTPGTLTSRTRISEVQAGIFVPPAKGAPLSGGMGGSFDASTMAAYPISRVSKYRQVVLQVPG